MGCSASVPSSPASPRENVKDVKPLSPSNGAENGNGKERGSDDATPKGTPSLKRSTPEPPNPSKAASVKFEEAYKDNDMRLSATRNYMATHEIAWKRSLKQEYSIDAGRPLGVGTFGVVKRCRNRETGKSYAIKGIKKQNMSESDHMSLKNEVNAMKIIGTSLNSLMLIDCFEDAEYFYLIIELCEGGDLYSRIKEGDYTEAYAAHIMRNIVQFIAQCHARHIIYRDVKPGNFIFLNSAFDSPLKGTDFGLSIYHHPSDGRLREVSGTPYYMAPEVIQQSYGHEADMWSVGVMAYQMLSGTLPFPGPPASRHLSGRQRTMEVFRNIVAGGDPDFKSPPWDQVSELATDFVQRCLHREVNKRMSAMEAISHPWLLLDKSGGRSLPLIGRTVVQRLQRFSWYGTFKQTLLRRVILRVVQLGDKEVEYLAKLFQEMDEDGSGTLTIPELSTGLTKAGYHITNDEIEKIGNIIDNDGSGDLDYDEFIAALVDWKIRSRSPQWTEAATAVFNEIDTDGGGDISNAEVAKLLGASRANDPRVVSAVMEADKDGDGKITLEEFMVLVKPVEGDELNMFDRRLSDSRRPSIVDKTDVKLEQILFSATKSYERKQRSRARIAGETWRRRSSAGVEPTGGSRRPSVGMSNITVARHSAPGSVETLSQPSSSTVSVSAVSPQMRSQIESVSLGEGQGKGNGQEQGVPTSIKF